MEGLLASVPQQMRESYMKQEQEMPAELLAQLHSRPEVLNLARTLAYHRHALETTPLDPAAATRQREYVHDLTEMLRTILCL